MIVRLRNLKPNFHQVIVGSMTLYFSYETIIGFMPDATGKTTARENEWGPTTGKHLNEIQPDKSARLTHDAFLDALRETMNAAF